MRCMPLCGKVATSRQTHKMRALAAIPFAQALSWESQFMLRLMTTFGSHTHTHTPTHTHIYTHTMSVAIAMQTNSQRQRDKLTKQRLKLKRNEWMNERLNARMTQWVNDSMTDWAHDWLTRVCEPPAWFAHEIVKFICYFICINFPGEIASTHPYAQCHGGALRRGRGCREGTHIHAHWAAYVALVWQYWKLRAMAWASYTLYIPCIIAQYLKFI